MSYVITATKRFLFGNLHVFFSRNSVTKHSFPISFQDVKQSAELFAESASGMWHPSTSRRCNIIALAKYLRSSIECYGTATAT